MAPWQAEDWRERGAELTVWADASPKQRHGRSERRELRALSGPEVDRYAGSAGPVGKEWLHLKQVCRLERQQRVRGHTQVTVSYAVSSLSPGLPERSVCCRFSEGIGISGTRRIGSGTSPLTKTAPK